MLIRKLLLIPVLLLVGVFTLTTAVDLALAGWLAVGWMREAVGGNPGGGGSTAAEDVFWSVLVGGGVALGIWVALRAMRALRTSWRGGRIRLTGVGATLTVGAAAFVVQLWTYGLVFLTG